VYYTPAEHKVTSSGWQMALIDNQPEHIHVVSSKRILFHFYVFFHDSDTQVRWWKGKTKVLRDKNAPVPIILPRIPHDWPGTEAGPSRCSATNRSSQGKALCEFSVALLHSYFKIFTCKTNTTQNQPHQIFNTQRTENKTTDMAIQQHSRKLLIMDILMSETC